MKKFKLHTTLAIIAICLMLIKAMEEYAQMVVKNLDIPPVINF